MHSRTVPLVALIFLHLGASPGIAQNESEPKRTVVGRVVDEKGEPIEGAGIITGPWNELSTDRALEHPLTRTNADGREMWIPTTYSRPSNLIDLSNGKYEKFRDIATLAITEVTEIVMEDG